MVLPDYLIPRLDLYREVGILPANTSTKSDIAPSFRPSPLDPVD